MRARSHDTLANRPMVVVGLLLAILVVAATVRLYGLRWDASRRCLEDGGVVFEEHHLHPDERFLTMVTSALELPDGWAQYFDTSVSPLNPHNRGFDFFSYGSLPVYLTKLAANRLGLDGYDRVHLVGRFLAALFSLTTVVLTFSLGKQVHGSTVGLLAALLLALGVLPIQQAHFFTVDTFATTLTVLALLFAVRVQQFGKRRDYLLFGAALGAAMACKISIFPLSLMLVIAAAGRFLGRRRTADGWGASEVEIEATLLRLGLAATTAFFLFRLLQPFSFQGPGILGLSVNESWWRNMLEIRELTAGVRDFPPGHQWTDRAALWFPWKNMVIFGLGPALGLTAWAGWSAAGWQLLGGRARHLQLLLPWAWTLVFFLHQGSLWVKTMRYQLPIYPTLALFAAWLLRLVWRWAGDRGEGWPAGPARTRHLAALSLTALVVLGTGAWAWAFTSIYRRPHSRIQASRWMYDNLPPGSAIANEIWDDALPLRLEGRWESAGFRLLDLDHYAEETPQKLEKTLATLEETDYLVLSSNRLYDSIPRLPMRYPVTVLYYRSLFSGELGFQRVAEFTSFPGIAGLEIDDQRAEEAFSVYDHPRVQIFAKTARWDVERARALLGDVDWSSIEVLTPREARGYKQVLMDEALEGAQRLGGTWSARIQDDREGAGHSRGLFDRQDLANRFPLVAWFVTLEVLGLIVFPLVSLALPRASDRGWALSKSVGLLLVGVGGWYAASLRVLPFRRSSLILIAGLLAGVSALVAWHRRVELGRWGRQRWRLLLGEESLFWGLLALMLLVRYLNPDLWHPYRGGEKPMDLAYFTAVLKSTFFPPFDPWFAGGYLNYYYFGFVLTAVPTLISGLVPSVVYNLAVPTYFALTATAGFAAVAELARSVVRRRGAEGAAGSSVVGPTSWLLRSPFSAGLLGALFVAVIGNLAQVRLLARALQELGSNQMGSSSASWLLPVRQTWSGVLRLLSGESLPFPNDWWFWNASRAISVPAGEVAPITEFPFFTFLFADLHAHMMALPFSLLAVALLVEMFAGDDRGEPSRSLRQRLRRVGREVPTLALAGLAIGLLWPLNSWDFPTFLMLGAAGVLVREATRPRDVGDSVLLSAGWRILVLSGLAWLSSWPFRSSFGRAYGRLEPWTGPRTPWWDFLTVHGFFLFILGTYLVLAGIRSWRGRQAGGAAISRRNPGGASQDRGALFRSGRQLVAGLPGILRWGLPLAAILVLAGWPIEGLLVALGAGGLALLLSPTSRPPERLMSLLILAGAALGASVEHVVVEGDVGRMNTVFKLYLQVWVLWGVAAAVAVVRILEWWPVRTADDADRSPTGAGVAVLRRIWIGAFFLLLSAVLLYPVLAVPARTRDRFTGEAGPGLDGSTFQRFATYRDEAGEIPLRWDGEAIRWLQENVRGSPVILEASVPPYRWGSRISVYTGLPTVIGWDWHQRQQRRAMRRDGVGRRLEDVRRIYQAERLDEVMPLIDRYEIRMIYVGAVERLHYGTEGLEKFEADGGERLREVYRNPGVRIYERIGEGNDSAVD